MALERIIEFVKVAAVDKIVPISFAVAGAVTYLGFDDVKIVSAGVAGMSVVVGTAAFLAKEDHYRKIKYLCENKGFPEELMKDEELRVFAKIYASTHGRMDEFQDAMKKYPPGPSQTKRE